MKAKRNYIRIIKEIKSANNNKVYTVILTYDLDGTFIPSKSTCSCIYEVFRKNPKDLCYHLKQACKEVKDEIRSNKTE